MPEQPIALEATRENFAKPVVPETIGPEDERARRFRRMLSEH
jgi:hypothetical protein